MKKIIFFTGLFFGIILNSYSQTFNSTTGALPDLSCTTTTEFPIVVTGVGILGVGNQFDQISINITHTFDGDLDISLIAPNGTIVDLSSDNGAGGDNFINTIFRSDAATSIVTGVAPFTGSFLPEGNLASLNGINADGTWILKICDDAGGDVGTLNSSALTFVSTPSIIPQKMSYQAVIRDAGNLLVANTPVGMRISVLQGSASGTPVYVETQNTTTNINGLASVQIGGGTVVSGVFSSIMWDTDSYFVKTETDPTGGTSYSIVGTSELLSVPYALFAANSAVGPAGPTGAQGIPGPTGATGAVGPTGIITVVPLNGFAGSGPYNNMGSLYSFLGPTTTITVTSATQKIYGSAVAPLATATASPTIDVRLGLGYQLGTGTITNFVGGNFAIVQITPVRNPQAAVGFVTGLTPGTYTVGVVILNSSASAISNNDFVNGWIMVTN